MPIPFVLILGLIGGIVFSLFIIVIGKGFDRKSWYPAWYLCTMFGVIGAVTFVSFGRAIFARLYPDRMFKPSDVPDAAVFGLFLTLVARLLSVFIGGMVGFVAAIILGKKELNDKKVCR